MTRFTSLSLLAGASIALALPVAHAQMGPPAEATWHWPLYEPVADTTSPTSSSGFKVNSTDPTRLVRGTPRANVWNSHMAYEEYAGKTDPHPGIDIRGVVGDIVEVPLAGEVVYIQNRDQCREGDGDKCRLFVRSGDLLYYLGHFSFQEAPNGTMIASHREMVQNTMYDNGVPDQTRVLQVGEQVGQLENYRSPANWDHLHISLFDVPYQYDNLDPLRYLTGKVGDPVNVRSGDEGETLTIVDDERPFVGPIGFEAESGGVIDTSNGCAEELSGPMDIRANITDTFFTSRPTPHPFPGWDTWNDTIGIKGARYVAQHVASGQTVDSQWYESPLGCVGTECGAWRARFPVTDPDLDRNDLVGDNDVFFAGTFLGNGPPVYIAGDFSTDIFDPGPSGLDHSPPDGAFEYIHVLTNGANENSLGSDGAWETTDLPDGPVVVTVEAWDNAGNLSARSVNVNIKNTSAPRTGPSWAPIYARDHDGDLGQIPSTLGGEPFWASPDVLIARVGDPQPNVNSPPLGTKLVVGETYNVYVRAHNPGCTDATGAKARVWVATPGPQLFDFNGLGESTATTVPAQQSALIGPIQWSPTAQDLDGAAEGHRCVVAQIGSDNEPLPAVSDPTTFVAAGSSKIVQRNVQTAEFEFWIRNVMQNQAASQVRLELEGFQGGRMQLLIERTPEMEAAWDPLCASYGAGSSVTCFHYDTWYVLEVHGDVGLSPQWPMAGVSQLDALVLYELPAGAQGRVTLTHLLDGQPVGGMIFTMSDATIIRVK